ncbi:MAG: hypothetical protein H8E28_06040 [Anaerolineae bacterium]|nr:hypothetical protein [Anaerolineae bacterium]
MLPEPDKLARTVKKLFRTAEEKRQEAELNRDVQVRMGRARLQRHIQNQKKMALKLRALAKRALALNDEARFRQIGRQLLWTQQDLQRWEQYLLSLELLQARRDQSRASLELLNAIKAMSESMNAMAGSQNVGELQRELEQGLARAANLDERMALMMEMMDSTLAADTQVDESALDGLQANLTEEVVSEETSAFDRNIEEGLQRIRKQLEDEARQG